MRKYYLVVGKKKVNITKLLNKEVPVYADENGNPFMEKVTLEEILSNLYIEVKNGKDNLKSRCFTGCEFYSSGGGKFVVNKLKKLTE